MRDSNYKLLVKPKQLHWLGILFYSAQVIYPHIIIPEFLKDKIAAGEPKSVAILVHEITHLKRIRDRGIALWYLSYIFVPKFRLAEEIFAYREEINMLEENGVDYDIDKYTEKLSSWVYLKMVSKEKAEKLLKA